MSSPFRAVLDALRPPRADLAWVTPSLVVGAGPTSKALGTLRKLGITAILDLRQADERAADFAWTEAVRRSGLHFEGVPVPDRAAPSDAQLEQGCAWVLGELADDGRVLVCCRAGAGRSATLVTAVLVRLGYPLHEAFGLLSAARHIANPTDPQLAALRRFAARVAESTETADQTNA